MPKITVVITTYNLEPFIGRCLDELLYQTFDDYNILIFDDCSTDNTSDILKSYISLHPERMRAVFLPENLGSPSKTRNTALDSGKIDGEYVIFLDGDDSIEPDFLKVLYELARENDSEISICAYDRVEAETERRLCVEMLGFPVIVDLPSNDDTLAFINGSLWNKLIKTSVIEDTRIPNFRVGEDLCFLQMLYQKCNRIAFTERILIHYHTRGNSVISNTQPEDIYAFASELIKLHGETSDVKMSATLELLAFVHIGISMAIRAKDNPAISMRQHLKWTYGYFADNFGVFKSSRFLKFRALRRHKAKGYALWICLLLYRLHLFWVFIFLYQAFRKISRRDIKF